MNEKRLELSLGKVQNTHEERELLQLRSRYISTVNIRASQVHERVDEEGTEIFDDEDGSPGDLSTCIRWSAVSYTVRAGYVPRSFTSTALLFLRPI